MKKTNPFTGLLARIRQILDRTPGWHAPLMWADAGGLYATDDDAWVYRELPLSMLRPGAGGQTPLDGLLRNLTSLGGGRDIHLLMHAWEEQADIPAGTEPELAEFLAGALTFFVPTRRMLIGVRLAKSPEAQAREARPLRAAFSAIDRLLGEFVPDFSAWDVDRESVTSVLDAAGATLPSSAVEAHLESWYTLGTRADVHADERDDIISLDETNIVEVCAVASLAAEAHDTHALMSSGRRGATVASVRGQLTGGSSQMGRREDSTGTLSKTSIILGRRSERSAVPWPVTLRRFPGLDQRPLPMRQLGGLDETLPCSTRRLSPSLNRINTAALRQVGFVDTVGVGDDAGAFVGLASPAFSYPFYLDIAAARRPVTLVTGGAGTGKTFLAENLAVQSALGHRRVIYVTATKGAGQALRDLAGGVDLPVNEPGIFDPFRWMPTQEAAALAQQTVAHLVPDLTAEERMDLAAGFRRAAATGNRGFEQAVAFADGITGVAKLRRAAQRSPYTAACVAFGSTTPLTLPAVTVADLSWYLPLDGETAAGADAGLVTATVDAAAATLITAAGANPVPGGTLVVFDGAGSVLNGPLTLAALAAADQHPGAVHVLVTTRHTAAVRRSLLLRHVDATIALGEIDTSAAEAALALTGTDPTPERVQWLADAWPKVDTEVVKRPALGLLRDRDGRRASILVGPVPPLALGSLTRGAAARYVTSRD